MLIVLCTVCHCVLSAVNLCTVNLSVLSMDAIVVAVRIDVGNGDVIVVISSSLSPSSSSLLGDVTAAAAAQTNFTQSQYERRAL